MKKWMIAALFTGLIIVLAACGGDETSSKDTAGTSGDSSSAATVELVASNWDFDKDSYTVPAGDITLELINEEGFHGIEIDGTDVKLDKAGSTTINLEAGEYTIRCIIPCGEGHGEMTAQLIVE